MIEYVFLVLHIFWCFGEAVVIQITEANEKDAIKMKARVAFVNYYADWCYFSQQLMPIFEETSNNFPPPDFTSPNRSNVVFGRVDCVDQEALCKNVAVNKYPTMLLFRYGIRSKKEYRMSRTVEAITEFINQQLTDAWKVANTVEHLNSGINTDYSNIILYTQNPDAPDLDKYKLTATQLRDRCNFHIAVGPEFSAETSDGPRLKFRDKNGGEELAFNGEISDIYSMFTWTKDKCIPLVQELTFENAEELTEENKPFLVLFKDKNDKASLDTYTEAVNRELLDEKENIMILYADGEKFSHPLMHLGKSAKDLPLLAIDSFQHMYLFDSFNNLNVNGKLKQFILDLRSEKLHREYHHGPDETSPEQTASQPEPDGNAMGQGNQAKGVPNTPEIILSTTTKPPSVFRKLKPSPDRYTLLKKTEL